MRSKPVKKGINAAHYGIIIQPHWVRGPNGYARDRYGFLIKDNDGNRIYIPGHGKSGRPKGAKDKKKRKALSREYVMLRDRIRIEKRMIRKYGKHIIDTSWHEYHKEMLKGMRP